MTVRMLVRLMLVGYLLSSQHATEFQHHQGPLWVELLGEKEANSVARVGVA